MLTMYTIPLYEGGVKIGDITCEEGDYTWQALSSAFGRIPNQLEIDGEFLVAIN